MSMIEVDPNLFIMCRLCLDETGQYQIVPKVQRQIKYCFEINVEPFDGLPQLICKKCESILSQYASIKQMYQEKQNKFMEKMKSNPNNPVPTENIPSPNENNCTQQHQDTVFSTQQIDSVKNNLEPGKKEKSKRKSLSLKLSKKMFLKEDESLNSKYENLCSNNEDNSQTIITNSVSTKSKSSWISDYSKTFVCRICSKVYKDKRDVMSHMKKHESLIMSYSNIINSHLDIAINKIDKTPNITGKKKYVVFSEDKIIKNEHALYYIVYCAKVKRDRSLSSSSDDDVVGRKSKYKRQRFISEDSQSSANIEVIEDNIASADVEIQNEKCDTNDKNDEDDRISDENVDCVNIDADEISNESSKETACRKEKPVKKPPQRNKMTITDIITACRNRYLNRHETYKNVSKLQENMESFLQHKFLSIGTKIVHKGLNSTGLLRYLEHKALDINWLQSKNSHSNIIIKTKLKDTNAVSISLDNLALKNISHYIKDHPTRDFVDVFENVLSEKEAGDASSSSSSVIVLNDNQTDKCYNNNVNSKLKTLLASNKETENEGEAVLVLRSSQESDKQNCTKILNASPVANPKQLPNKKSNTPMPTETLSGADDVLLNYNNDESNMSFITSVISLANYDQEKHKEKNCPPRPENTQKNGTETNMPRIKVKSVSELMPDKSKEKPSDPIARTGWTATSLVPIASNASMVYVANVSQYKPSEPATVLCYPQRFCNVNNNRIEIPESNAPPPKHVPTKVTQECVIMHTVELPNTKTNSPFKYFQRLLQLHNIVLLDSTAAVPHTMKCIIKFTLGFQQENNAPVSLSLTLFYDGSVFCIKVTDMALKEIDISKLSANWQWEILKVFKGDIVNKLHINALKHGLDINAKVNYFVSLLKSIVFTK
nr:uncharacterized protein LOC116767624 [Danaus plexippus plexippus]